MLIFDKIEGLIDLRVSDEMYTGYKNLRDVTYSDYRHPHYHSLVPVATIYTDDKEYKMFRQHDVLEALLKSNGYKSVKYLAVNHLFRSHGDENMYDPIYIGSMQENEDWHPEFIYRGFRYGQLGNWTWEDDGWDTHGQWEFHEDNGEDEEESENIQFTDWNSEEFLKKYGDRNKKFRAIKDNYSGIWEFKNGEWMFLKDDEILLKKCVQTDVNSNIINIKGKRQIFILEGDE